MKLRDATLDDCAFIATLFDNDEYEAYFAETDTTEEEWRERFGLFADGENKIILEGDTPVGWFTYERKGSVCEIGILVLRQDKIGSGIGYRAFHFVIASLPPEIQSVRLDVQVENRHAVAFYKRYGFQIVGEEKQPIGDHEALYYNMELQRCAS